MPVLAFLLLLRRVEARVFFHLNYEADFGAETEVAHCECRHFLNEGLTGQFKFILALLDQVFYFVRLQLHY